MDLIGDLTNGVIIVQISIVVVVMLTLKELLFTPFLHVVERRERELKGGGETGAGDVTKQADAIAADCEQKIRAAREAAVAERDKARVGAQRARDGELSSTAEAIQKKQAEALAALRAEIDGARKQLDAEARAVAGEIASKLLGRKVA